MIEQQSNNGQVRRSRIGWYMYDWASSAFTTSVVTVFLGPYLTSLAKEAAGASGVIEPLGPWLPILPESLFPYCISLSVFLQILILPFLGAIADYSHRQKDFLALFAIAGGLCTTLLLGLTSSTYLLGAVLFVVANLCYGASIVFYNSLLNSVAAADERDKVSSFGFAFGYIGGGLLLALNLGLYSGAFAALPWLADVGGGMAVRISLMSAGLWWLVFTIPTLVFVRTGVPAKTLRKGQSFVVAGIRQLGGSLKELSGLPQTRRFLIAYLLYNDGIQTVIPMAVVFGQRELGLDTSVMVSAVLMVQIVAFFGSLLFAWVAAKIGARNAVVTTLVVWLGVVIYAFGFVPAGSAVAFYSMAAVIAIVMGGSQSLSRSIYAGLIPHGREAEFFSLYEVAERGTSWLGPLAFGIALQWSGSYRWGILSLVVFLLAGLLLLLRVRPDSALVQHHKPAA